MSKSNIALSSTFATGPVARSPKLTGAELQAARAAARERYAVIAEALKCEAGVTRHYHHNEISGLAWTDDGKILAPAGVTRRQLYVLAHECGHIVLHSSPTGQSKPGHVKEHEAETYAHRAFARYGVEVPAQSAPWARAYVGQWIVKDRSIGLPICPEAAAFAAGLRSPHAPLPSVDGKPESDFSRQLDRFIARGTRTVARLEQAEPSQQAPQAPPAAAAEFSRHERALLERLLKQADRLERRRVAHVHRIVATTLEEIERRVHAGQSALPLILRGLDTLQQLDLEKRQKRHQAIVRHMTTGDGPAFALWTLVAAAGCFLAGWAVSSTYHYTGAFCAVAAVAMLTPAIIRSFLSD